MGAYSRLATAVVPRTEQGTDAVVAILLLAFLLEAILLQAFLVRRSHHHLIIVQALIESFVMSLAA